MATPLTPTALLATFKAEGIAVREYSGWRDRCRCHTGGHEDGVGWAGRGWGTLNGQVTHITAGDLGTRTVQQYIASAILGDPNIPCKVQAVIAPNGELWLVSAGRCNHAGLVGGHVQEHMAAADFSTSDNYDDRFRGGSTDGNAFTFGYENITSKTMTAAQYATSVKANAALARKFGWTGQESVGHGEISSARYYVDPGLDMGKFRRDVMARVKAGPAGTAPAPVEPATEPTPVPTPTPAPVETAPVITTISANLAGYDKVRGMANRIKRAQTTIPAYLAPKRPTWFHFQECAIDMFPVLDLKLPEYKRVGAGGKGRESYYRRDAGITIIEAALLNVEHMLLKDTKEHLVIAWEKDGYKAVDVNFHNENEGSTYQSVQLRDVMNHARDMADRHGIPHANILVTGDSNTKAASYLARLWGWTEAIYSAAKKIDLQYHSTNGWSGLSLGRRIDVDVTPRSAEVLEAEQLYGAVIADHWPHRLKRRLVK